ncbi:TetR/AcrR family transcriptional regulator [Leisingera sp. MMG026]|uniref:TetR/AcrR family transcriptional regulator n=1 Tax=Leisingera sp. MMG026 TaxID=2909982 RepID=UPI001F438CB6|nr:TetR/AcrR family transcriptional regulator [Leisingera sp. MMG026]MCF6433585.1 TetR/AcrR family transcriptional regulator [Leisingera sp. MMG026]
MTSENPTIQTKNLIFKAGTSLSTELILDTALTLAEEVGSLEKLSLRKIGKALNADPTAIYRYFRSKNELLQAMADRIYARMLPARDMEDEDWATQLTEIASSVRSVYLVFPTIGLEVTNLSDSDARAASYVIEAIYLALEKSGLPERQIPIFGEVLLSMAIGVGTGEHVFGSDPVRGKELVRQKQSKLDPAEYPNLTRYLGNPIPSNDEVFELAVQMLLEKISASANANTKS